MSHELVHFVKKYSPAKFKVFADFLIEEYGKHGVSTSTLLADKMAELGEDDPDKAFEEMVADACERMLLDSNVMLKLAKLKKIDLDLFEKIRLHILDLLNKIRAEYKKMNYAPQSDEAKTLLAMEDVIGKLHEKFEEMVVDATETYQTIGTKQIPSKNIKKQAKKRYWRPDMTSAEVAEVHRLTKNDLYKNDQYIDNGVKWLYNTSKGTTCFALYSTANEENPTVLYCSKEKEAQEDMYAISSVLHERSFTNDGDESRRESISKVFISLGIEYDKSLVDNGGTPHNGVGNGVVGTHKTISRIRPRRALRNCLENIEKTQLQRTNESGDRGRDGIDSHKSQPKFQKKRDSYAPTFYSKMEQVINDIKINKMGATGVVSYLTGKGIKKEEIKWSGIETFLEGKKSVAKEDLQEFVKGSQMQIEESVLDEGQVKFQKKKPTNRELLINALESTIDTSDIDGLLQSNIIQRYKESIAKVEELESHLADVKKEIYELSFRKGGKDMARLRELREDKIMTENRINTYDRRLLEIEATKPMKDLLKREKDMVRKKYEEEGRVRVKKALTKKNESIAFKKERENLQKLILSTAKWLESPGKNDVKCPDILRKPFADFLASIDTSSKRLLKGGAATKNDYKFAMAMDSLATAIERIKSAQDPNAKADGDNNSIVELGGYLDLPENFAENIRRQAEAIKGFIDIASDGDSIINDMSSEELKELSKIIRILKKSITEMQALYTNYRFANAQALGRNTMEYADSLGESKDSTKLKDFAMWDNTVPFYAFKRFGEGGESVFESLMDSQDKLAFLADEILKFKKKSWTDKEVSAWSKDTHTIDLPSGRQITLTTADAMSIYCLSRRFQGKQHLVQGGVRVVGLTQKGKKSPDVKANLVSEDTDGKEHLDNLGGGDFVDSSDQ